VNFLKRIKNAVEGFFAPIEHESDGLVTDFGIIGLYQNLAAIVDPQLVPVRADDGFCLGYVSQRTGERPWFS